jgi:hypothetical protein
MFNVASCAAGVFLGVWPFNNSGGRALFVHLEFIRPNTRKLRKRILFCKRVLVGGQSQDGPFFAFQIYSNRIIQISVRICARRTPRRRLRDGATKAPATPASLAVVAAASPSTASERPPPRRTPPPRQKNAKVCLAPFG